MAVINTERKKIALLTPEEYFRSQNMNEIPITMTSWIVRCYLSFLITGDQGTGKTTFLKSIIRFYEPSASLRINEKQPEMNLRYAYPNRNIVEFYETPSISGQDGLNFQKKTTGTVNIIGEIAEAIAASWWVQTCKVGSRSGAGTHHGQTTPDTITAISDDMIKVNGYSDAKAVERMVADVLDFDIHMNKVDGKRYCERITEVAAVKTQDYPYPDLLKCSKDGIDINTAIAINEQEYRKRQTDRTTFEYHNLVEYDFEQKKYVFKRMFSEENIKRITKDLDKRVKEKFEREMDLLLSTNPNA